MNYVIIFVCTIFLINEFLHKRWDSPLCFFLLLWDFILIGDIYHFMNTYYVSDNKTYLIILVGVVSFIIGYTSHIKILKKSNFYDFSYRYNLFIICLIISMIIMFPLFIFGMVALLSGNFHIVKLAYYTGTGVKLPKIWMLLFIYFARPMLYVGNCVFAISLFNNNKNKLEKILQPIALFEYFVATAMRFAILFLFISTFFAILSYSCKNHKKYFVTYFLKNKNKYIVFLLLILLIFIMTYNGSKLLETIYMYTSASVIGLDVMLSKLPSQYTYGLVSTYGFIHIPSEFFEKLLGLKKTKLILQSELCIETQQNTIFIGDNIKFNAFYTMFYNNYIDGRLVGVIILSSLFGYFGKYIYIKYKNTLNFRYFALYLFLMCMIMSSIVRFPFSESTMTFAIFYILNFSRKPKRGY